MTSKLLFNEGDRFTIDAEPYHTGKKYRNDPSKLERKVSLSQVKPNLEKKFHKIST